MRAPVRLTGVLRTIAWVTPPDPRGTGGSNLYLFRRRSQKDAKGTGDRGVGRHGDPAGQRDGFRARPEVWRRETPPRRLRRWWLLGRRWRVRGWLRLRRRLRLRRLRHLR